jgi:hypothetical protein
VTTPFGSKPRVLDWPTVSCLTAWCGGFHADHGRKHETGGGTVTWGLDANRPITEALQLRPVPDVGLLGGGLMNSSPSGPGDDEGGFDLALGQAHAHAPDFLD